MDNAGNWVTEFQALSIDPRVGISQSASETDGITQFLALSIDPRVVISRSASEIQTIFLGIHRGQQLYFIEPGRALVKREYLVIIRDNFC